MHSPTPEYRHEPDGTFVLTHFNHATPFASFLPGIAGTWGIPLWAFYVNRGQGVCSFGLRDKDHSISEFLPANWAYQLVYRQGFRTFVRLQADKTLAHHEPFTMEGARDPGCTQTLYVRPHEITLREQHGPLGLETEVTYFTLPHESLAALVRIMKIRNTSTKTTAAWVLDGLPLIVPHGLGDSMLKHLRYIAQPHIEVVGLAERTPGFRTKATIADSAVVEEVKGVNFCFGYEAVFPHELLLPLVDPAVVFGTATDGGYPEFLLREDGVRVPGRQMTENQFPSALLLAEWKLKPGEERTLCSFYGHAADTAQLALFAQRARSSGYVQRKREENHRLVQELTQPCMTVSSHAVFSAYARQNLLDNALRGGMPTTISHGERPVTLPLFARKHGDLERDYNYFIVEPTYYAQGESNYRDVNQNRRHDVFLNPDTKADDIVFFMNLIQADGFNPLLVRPRKMVCTDTPDLQALVARALGRKALTTIVPRLTREFELGRLLTDMQEERMAWRMPREEFVAELLPHVHFVEDSAHGHGYWTDHWTYNLDLIDSFRAIYPDRWADILFRRRDFVYADSHVFVRPRAEKYVLSKNGPTQIDSLVADADRKALIEARPFRAHAVRTQRGRGHVYFSTLAPKLLTLAAVKLASLDSHGAGIEMEADRPNWNDALNGLPSQFGSSLCETFELKRLILLLQEILPLAPADFQWKLPVEAADLIRGLSRLLQHPSRAPSWKRTFNFWDRSTTLKEKYRARVRAGFEGTERKLSAGEIGRFLKLALAKTNAGIASARDRKTGLYCSYFRYEMSDYTTTRRGDRTIVCPVRFRQIRLPLFLEGLVHALRVEKNPKIARDIVRAVKQSPLFDRTLNMYKVNTNLEKEPKSIGRIRTFARGWLENESIWLHMEYKFLLEMLRAGLHPEFFEDFRHCAIPFLKPETYGRSTTENSSFLVSEAYPDSALAGKGYMARLSGATAEFIHMWIVMCAGEYPFRVNKKGELEAELNPAIPAWLFTTQTTPIELTAPGRQTFTQDVPPGSFGFMFLGRTLVLYHQDAPVKDTFGPGAARIQSLRLTYEDGTMATFYGSIIPTPHAEALRAGRIFTIQATMA